MEKEKMVSMYDPTVDAYRQIPLSRAKKFTESVKDLNKKIVEVEKEVLKEEAYNKLKK